MKWVRFIIRTVLIIMAVIILAPIILGVLWLVGASWSNAHPVFRENVAKVDWLPASASNVSFYKTYSFTAYEFDIPESGFVSLAKERNWTVSEIQGEAQRVMTYRMGGKIRDRFPLPKSDLSTEEQLEEYQQALQIIEPRVQHGLMHEVRHANGGGITVVYDRTGQRAYVQSNPR